MLRCREEALAEAKRRDVKELKNEYSTRRGSPDVNVQRCNTPGPRALSTMYVTQSEAKTAELA
jgi:hypothetical protein